MKYLPLLLAAVWSMAVFMVTLMPSNHIPESQLLKIPFIDKAIHLFLFIVLTLFWSVTFYFQKNFSPLHKYAVMFAVLTGIILGATTEILQTTLPVNRHGNVTDFACNIIGTVFGAMLFVYVIRPNSSLFDKHKK